MGTVRAIFLTIFSATLAASVLVACAGVSAIGGLLGAGLSLAGVLAIFLLTAGTQSGCSANVCLSIVEPCLTQSFDASPPADALPDATVQPCLSDAGRFDVCLSQLWDGGDSGPERLDACLTLDFGPPPDAGADDGSDVGADRDPGPDLPCLTDGGPPDATEDAEVLGAVSPERREVIRRLAASGALPDDVARRLRAFTGPEES